VISLILTGINIGAGYFLVDATLSLTPYFIKKTSLLQINSEA